MNQLMVSIACLLLLLGCSGDVANAAEPSPPLKANQAVATFAGGCFWCMEPPFDKVDGVISTTSGYSGGPEKDPTYRQVASGQTGHTEVVQVIYDPSKVSYERLLKLFWHNIDPTVENRQFCDHGPQYRTTIFVHNKAQRLAAEKSKSRVAQTKTFKESIKTPIETFKAFYPAEEYHQNFYKKNPAHYQRYRKGCGRDARLNQLWNDKTKR